MAESLNSLIKYESIFQKISEFFENMKDNTAQ